MRATKVVALALLVALAAAPAPALADPGGRGGRGGPGMGAEGVDAWAGMADRHMGRIMDQLKLTPEQRGKVETIRARHMEQSKGVREELRKKRLELFTLIRGAKTTREQAIARQREVDALHAKLSEARLAAWFEARSVLTPEQLALLEKLPAGPQGKRKGGWKGHGQKRWGNP